MIPDRAERVVTEGLVNHDAALALGVIPVGITSGKYSDRQVNGVWPWAMDALGDAKPEVLPTEEEYQNLSQIAPTVAQSGEHPNYRS